MSYHSRTIFCLADTRTNTVKAHLMSKLTDFDDECSTDCIINFDQQSVAYWLSQNNALR